MLFEKEIEKEVLELKEKKDNTQPTKIKTSCNKIKKSNEQT